MKDYSNKDFAHDLKRASTKPAKKRKAATLGPAFNPNSMGAMQRTMANNKSPMVGAPMPRGGMNALPQTPNPAWVKGKRSKKMAAKTPKKAMKKSKKVSDVEQDEKPPEDKGTPRGGIKSSNSKKRAQMKGSKKKS